MNGVDAARDDDQRRTRRTRRFTLLRKAIHLSHDAIFDEPFHIEIEENSYFTSRLAQIRNELSTVDRNQPLDRLDFDDDRVLDEQIDTVAKIQRLAAVGNRQRLLPLQHVASRQQFVGEKRLVRGFQQSRSELLVDADRGRNDAVGQRVEPVLLRYAARRCKVRGSAPMADFIAVEACRAREVEVSAICEF
jgi:hypothetical protein